MKTKTTIKPKTANPKRIVKPQPQKSTKIIKITQKKIDAAFLDDKNTKVMRDIIDFEKYMHPVYNSIIKKMRIPEEKKDGEMILLSNVDTKETKKFDEYLNVKIHEGVNVVLAIAMYYRDKIWKGNIDFDLEGYIRGKLCSHFNNQDSFLLLALIKHNATADRIINQQRTPKKRL
jgi:hypothetical protein